MYNNKHHIYSITQLQNNPGKNRHCDNMTQLLLHYALVDIMYNVYLVGL